MTRTTSRTFGGANIKGTPAMSAQKVGADLRVLRRSADVIGLQEFKWGWYWRTVDRLLNPRWLSFPTYKRGAIRPVDAAQGILWKRRLFWRVDCRAVPAYDFSVSTAGIMDDRFLRAALLRDRATGLECWYGSTHFVVGGDGPRASDRRRDLLRMNLRYLDRFLSELNSTGSPVVFELDANIHRGTWAYDSLMAILDRHGARVHGEHGIEFLFSMDGDKARVVVERPWRIGPDRLNTDHETRLVDHYLTNRWPR